MSIGGKLVEGKQKVVIIGLGYVGSALAEAVLKNPKYQLIGYDISEEKIKEAKQRFKKIEATTDESVIKDANIVIVSVPTPVYIDYTPNLTPLKKAANSVLKYLKKGQLIILESTVNPGASEEIIIPILESNGLKTGEDFYFAHCPERIDPGNKKWTIFNIPRVVGGYDQRSLEKAYKFYKSILKAPIYKIGGLKEAEASKIVENTFRDINIAYVNELAKSFDRLGIDVLKVIKGASTKPFAFLAHFPSCGVGGHCIGVDPYYLIRRAEKAGFEPRFLKIARTVNNSMPGYTVDRLKSALREASIQISKARVGVLGLSYKKNIGDLRESPAIKITKILKKRNIRYLTFDPFVLKLSDVKSIEELMKKSNALILAVDHNKFSKITPQILKKYQIKVLIDGKNYFDKEKFISSGIIHRGVGR